MIEITSVSERPVTEPAGTMPVLSRLGVRLGPRAVG